MNEHQATSTIPSSSLKTAGSSRGSKARPIGTPSAPPARNGNNSFQGNASRTDKAPVTWPTSAPNTVNTAARLGSSTQAQIAIDTMLKAKPDKPCTKPATAAPPRVNHNIGPKSICCPKWNRRKIRPGPVQAERSLAQALMPAVVPARGAAAVPPQSNAKAEPGTGVKPRSPRAITASRPPFSRSSACWRALA